MKSSRVVLLAVAAIMAWGLTGCPVEGGVGVGYGPAPDCPYGYFEYPPYDCAPYGYYGPEWFPGGVFLGAGPWYHGPHRFWGHVDNHYDRRHGFGGPFPQRGERRDEGHPVDRMQNFHGNEMHNGRGHVRQH
jgi:hypothetical protein